MSQTKRSIGYLVASINLSRLSGLIEDIVLGKTGRLYLVDQKLQVLAGSEKNLILRPIPLDEDAGRNWRQSPAGSIKGKFNGQHSFIHYPRDCDE